MTAQGRSARRAMASANTCRCICPIILFKKSNKLLVFIYLKKNPPGPLLLFSFPKPRSLDCGRIRTPLRFRVGARPRPMLLGSCASRAVRGAGGGGQFFMRGCVFARDVRFARTRLGAREPRVAARGAHATR
jgi:hypothetical protein